jgi:hypothetical protein
MRGEGLFFHSLICSKLFIDQFNKKFYPQKNTILVMNLDKRLFVQIHLPFLFFGTRGVY